MPSLSPSLPPPLPLSIFVIAKDEADRIGATLDAVAGLADEVIVVDSGSTDGTQAIAEAKGARVIHNDFAGYGPQKRFAEEQCRNTWLLNLDADEVVPPDMVADIRRLFEGGVPAEDAYTTRIAEVFPGEEDVHPLAYALSPVRLYRRDRGRYSASIVHDRVDLLPGARVGALKGTIRHRSVRSLGDQIAKLNAYSDRQADDLAARGKTIPAWRVFVEFPAAFLKAYVGRRHAVRGVYGFLTAMNYAIARHLRIAKHIERRRLAARARRDG
ncbi:glycosyltransferase family 2 protein [Salinarimonas ramus]|uniref:Glycosyltransferase RP128 n=1 Tax=Salinarimonas ramus TaxID=690164 RepID=A0A917V859_9HYPH|nr:glycosyltransferase family 2 protein [Salinarimonas ramus]GGK48174.1 putative glycosyltransferase RP128 [Salinarimonas ramus]